MLNIKVYFESWGVLSSFKIGQGVHVLAGINEQPLKKALLVHQIHKVFLGILYMCYEILQKEARTSEGKFR